MGKKKEKGNVLETLKPGVKLVLKNGDVYSVSGHVTGLGIWFIGPNGGDHFKFNDTILEMITEGAKVKT